MSRLRLFLALMLGGILGACGTEQVRTEGTAAVDPATRLALEVPLLVDPGLDTQSRRFAVMSDPAPLDGSLPLDDFAAATVAAARAEANTLAGGQEPGAPGAVRCPACAAPTLAERAVAVAGRCAQKLVPDMTQGARQPGTLPIYPRSHLREAMAIAGAGCGVRAVSFTAPVPEAEATAFYRRLGARNGFRLEAARDARMAAMLGERPSDNARFAVIARPARGKTSQVDLIVSGF